MDSDAIIPTSNTERSAKTVNPKVLLSTLKTVVLANCDESNQDKEKICLNILFDVHHPVFGEWIFGLSNC